MCVYLPFFSVSSSAHSSYYSMFHMDTAVHEYSNIDHFDNGSSVQCSWQQNSSQRSSSEMSHQADRKGTTVWRKHSGISIYIR